MAAEGGVDRRDAAAEAALGPVVRGLLRTVGHGLGGWCAVRGLLRRRRVRGLLLTGVGLTRVRLTGIRLAWMGLTGVRRLLGSAVGGSAVSVWRLVRWWLHSRRLRS
ncbi:hypothetical protein GCM10009527_041160 [Actinomadura nitritigenes]